MNDSAIISKAEKNIKETLNLDPTYEALDKTGKVIKRIDSDLLRIKDNTSKWDLERLNKDKYSTRTEHISKSLNVIEKIERNIKEIAGEVIEEDKKNTDTDTPDTLATQ